MQSKANERLAERVEQVLAHMHERLGRKASPALADFVRRFFARVAPEDVLSQSVEGLYGAVVSLWKFAEMRPKGAPGIRAFNPRTEQDGWSSAHTVIQLVNDDMPFLVDTVAMTLAGLGHGVHLLIHPIVNISRDADGRRREAGGEQAGAAKPESLMHVEIGELTNADALGEIEAKLQAALADVRDSVADWRAMLARLRDTIGDLQRNPPPVESDEASEAIALLEWMGADNFTFLGYREYDYGDDAEMMRIVADTGLGILRNPGRRVMVGV
ncbi:MAG TPA: hypothetical protein VEU47_15035, partial [Candidatus Cybelea sp.]|nr:hypothetical protein [Candidatus Cybelea sp.]